MPSGMVCCAGCGTERISSHTLPQQSPWDKVPLSTSIDIDTLRAAERSQRSQHVNTAHAVPRHGHTQGLRAQGSHTHAIERAARARATTRALSTLDSLVSRRRTAGHRRHELTLLSPPVALPAFRARPPPTATITPGPPPARAHTHTHTASASLVPARTRARRRRSACACARRTRDANPSARDPLWRPPQPADRQAHNPRERPRRGRSLARARSPLSSSRRGAGWAALPLRLQVGLHLPARDDDEVELARPLA